jgi:fibronectin-binding autotransporter adhesin
MHTWLRIAQHRTFRLVCLAAVLSVGSVEAQTTATWEGADGNMATAFNWSTGLVPSAVAGDTMRFAGSGVSTLSFPGTTFSGNNGLGGLLVTADQLTALSITNAGPSSGSSAVFRLRPNAPVTIEAGAGPFSFGASGTSFFLNLAASGSNRFTNNSANIATIGPQVSINASTGTNGQAIFDGSGDWLVSGAFTVALSRGLFKEGTGLLTLSGNNAFTSGTTISGGTLRLEGNGRLGGGSYAGAITNDARFELAGDLEQTLSGVISGSGAVAVTGPGRLTLSGVNSFSGGTSLAGGTLRLGNSGGLGFGTLTIDGGSLEASTGSLTVANAQIWNAGFGFVGSQPLAMSGGVTLAADIPLDVAASRLTISGTIDDAAADRGLTKTGAGLLALESFSNTYGGQTSIAAGTLSIAFPTSLPGWDQAGRYAVAGGATLAVGIGVSDAEVATILGTGNFAANAALGFDTAAGDRTFATAIANTPAGPLGLTKLGNNTLTLTAANTFTAPATVAAGTLVVGSGGSLAADVSVA